MKREFCFWVPAGHLILHVQHLLLNLNSKYSSLVSTRKIKKGIKIQNQVELRSRIWKCDKYEKFGEGDYVKVYDHSS